MSKYKEKRRARIIFKRLKAGITKPEDLTAEELELSFPFSYVSLSNIN